MYLRVFEVGKVDGFRVFLLKSRDFVEKSLAIASEKV